MTESEKVAVLVQFKEMIGAQIKRINRSRFLSFEDIEELENTFRFFVWKSLDRYDSSRSSLSTWVRNTLDLAGRKFLHHYFMVRVKKVSHTAINFTDFMAQDEDDDAIDRASGFIDRGFADVELRDLFKSLPNKRYAAMLWKRIHGASYKEIAECYGVSHQAVEQFMNKHSVAAREYI